MNKQELKELTYKMVEERVNKGTELFNTLYSSQSCMTN